MHFILSVLSGVAALAPLAAAQPTPTAQVTIYNFEGEGIPVPANGECGNITDFPGGLESIDIPVDQNIHCQLFNTTDCTDDAVLEVDETVDLSEESYSGLSCFVE
ncbi:hypothetical protein BDW69DRAFT_186549 [Aspergillus filifer]